MEDNTFTFFGNIKYQQFNWEWNLLYEELEVVLGSGQCTIERVINVIIHTIHRR